ncbi:hypothetical protein EJ994_13315 [Maribacter sp. MJ134]|uniref:hypothetical protein n=1 Tax=Maribacter sp. MJ134 TaxID=2496865 RepID=UPI000F82E991|nr:hypothetical protein [Maribacter sp. MJ134]AZQ57308.1 hypothetical protein EJ994_00225 [Maribacter sp. MJ134]AZQ59730.1 hypothetical protein EJ994_13315 [Maribacter sp. MJ134]
MTKKEIYEKANNVIGIEGMSGNERLFTSGLMDLFDASKKKDKYTARIILEALKFDELSIGRMVGYSTDSLKYPNPWDFPNENSNGQVDEKKGTLEYTNLVEIGMGAPIGGICKLSSIELDNVLIDKWCGGPAIWTRNGLKVAIPIWEKNFFHGTFQKIVIVDLKKHTLTKYKKKFRVLDLRSFSGDFIVGFDSPVHKMKKLEFNYLTEPVEKVRGIK